MVRKRAQDGKFKSSGKWGGPCSEKIQLRVTKSMKEKFNQVPDRNEFARQVLDQALNQQDETIGTLRSLPLYSCPVSAGTPTVTEDYLEGKIDLAQYLIRNPQQSFSVRVFGDSMIDAGIYPDDLLVVDKSMEARNDQIVIAMVNGELLVKRLKIKEPKIYLKAENNNYPDLVITEEMNFQILGVVTGMARSFS